jgi:NDP-sugar pyrophosphorylase family protein
MEKEIFPQIIEDTKRFYGYKFKGFWMDIGRISSYIDIQRFLLDKNKIDKCQGKNCKIYGNLQETCIGDNVTIGKNTKLKSVVVYDNATIGENVNLSYCVVGENCKIADLSDIKNSVIGDNEKLEEKTFLDNKAVWTQPVPEGYPDKQIGNVIEK